MYLDDIAAVIRSHIPDEQMPSGDAQDLLRIYAVLLRTKGANVTNSDIHDAWASWMAKANDNHESLVPFDELDEEVKVQDAPFAVAVRSAAQELKIADGSAPDFSEILFPLGPPNKTEDTKQAFELYKIMVDSSESLVSRRQGVNTFFLTMNGALLTASGLIVQSAGDEKLGGIGVGVLAVAGAILCLAWRSLISSFGQLNTGKFKVINTIESHLNTAIYAAEWEALGRGEDPKIYRSFTSREIWVPDALLVLHIITVVAAILVATGCISFGGGSPKP
jgi:hypothetical protein